MTTLDKPAVILVVEEDPKIAELIMDHLRADNFVAIWQKNRAKISEAIKNSCPALLLLGVNSAQDDGDTICTEMRRHSQIPIIMLANGNQEADRLRAFETGADDYICKPFNPRELLFRIKAILRRMKFLGASSPNAKLQLETMTYKAKLNGRQLDLTPIEFRILAALAQSPGRVFTRNDLLDRAYPDHRTINDRTIDSHIKNLRRKLSAVNSENEIVHSIYGVGYKLEVKDWFITVCIA